MISKHEVEEGIIVRYTNDEVDYYGIVDSIKINYRGRHFTNIRWINHQYHSINDLSTCEIFDSGYTKYWSIPNGEQNENL